MNEGPMDRWFSNGIPFDPANAGSAALWAANAEGEGMINSMSLGNVSLEEWRRVRAPTLLLIGDREVIYRNAPRAALETALREIPGLTGEIVPNANHLAARANPTFVNDRITRFLHDGLPSGSSAMLQLAPGATCDDVRMSKAVENA